MQNYRRLEDKIAGVTALREALRIIDWDRAVMMPRRGNEQRARQCAVLSVLIHNMTADAEFGVLVDKARNDDLDDWQRANVELIARLHLHATAAPADLVERKTKQDARTEMLWREAKAESNFKKVLPELEKLIALNIEYAEAKAAKLDLSPYEAVMDYYAPSMRTAEIDAIFDDYAAFMPAFLDSALAKQGEILPLDGPFPIEAQVALARKAAEDLGFDFSRGRLDVSAHPFSTGVGDDVRITVRYDENDFFSSLQGAAHEVGHALYDRYTPRELQTQPVGISQYMGMMIHESQSLSLDMQLCRSREYWEYMAPLARKAFGKSGPAWGAENLWRHAARIGRGYIRIDAGEITYPAHIILRYRLEKDLIAGKLKARDLPDAWNAMFKELIGLEVTDNRQGCLQDIHWYGGDFGYFPAYALGAMTAAQMVEKMRKDIPGVFAGAAKGDFTPFTGWLKDNVQSKGCLYGPQALIEKATGRKLSAAPFKAHLAERYGA